jgi:hypothetical protein
MRKRSLGLAWMICVLALASCVSPEELRREDEATCAGYGFHPGTDAFATCLQGAASPDCVPATAVLGILGLLGPGVGAVLAPTRASDPTPSLNRRCQQRADAGTQAQWIGNQD